MTEREKSDGRVQTTCLVILAIVAIGAALYYLRPVVVPFLLALVIVYSLRPVVEWQRNSLGFSRGLAIVGALVATLILLAASGLLLAAFVVKFREHLPEFNEQLHRLSEQFQDSVHLERLGLDGAGSLLQLPETAGRQFFASIMTGMANMLSEAVLVGLFVMFIFIGGASRPEVLSPFRADIDRAISRYIVSMIILSLATGALIGGSFAALGVKYPLEFGVLAFLLNFIPYIGSFITVILPLPIVLLSPDLSPFAKITAIAAPVVIQGILGNVVAPRVMGKSQDLHPVTVLMAMAFFGMIWGIMGAVLAVPLAGVLRIILAQSAATQPVAAWLSGDLDGVRIASETAKSS